MIIAGTGHRPQKLGGYGPTAWTKLVDLAEDWLAINSPDLVISGMALGWDQALAEAAYSCSIPYHAYIPFIGQESMWPQQSKDVFNRLCANATTTIIICEGGYAAWKMQKRNEAMVDACDQVLALFDGSKGGTWNCIKYAESRNKVIHNLWSEWKELQ